MNCKLNWQRRSRELGTVFNKFQVSEYYFRNYVGLASALDPKQSNLFICNCVLTYRYTANTISLKFYSIAIDSLSSVSGENTRYF